MNIINNNSINHITPKDPENPSNEHCTQVYITLDQDELSFLGLPKELWDDSESICDAIHGLLFDLNYSGSY